MSTDSAPAAEPAFWITCVQFHEAVRECFRYSRCSADFLRRKCNLGYNKATIYVQQMEELGMVGPSRGMDPRLFLFTWADWIGLLKLKGVNVEKPGDLYCDPAT
jgi:hypothetical protein